ncbi:MAG: PHP domain-containing protein [Candidatus Paraimprobicoccus trichonymphae]|uniref:PHP domain-containing protein n=1 Tax=Candidatus Paraimprobicoccus trichonymphae TaxID=3033793 RepID=A0AA48HWM7_9FIRM|nr:MAG: PHP domain-containing protein [Candidatus Paraimprobicoccus trichonymphae]
MRLIADMHCHTIASSHAYSTISENVQEAKKIGLKFLAITDHTGDMPGAPDPWYFDNLKIIPREIDDLVILKGVESNILNNNGEIDVPNEELEWVVASIHDVAYFGDHTLKDCTNAWLNVAKNPIVNVIGHSGLCDFKYDYKKVIPEFGKNGKLVEINNSSFVIRPKSIENCKQIALLCKEYGVSIIVNSDSHFYTQIGKFDKALELLKDIDFPEKLIINSSYDRFKVYLEKYTKIFLT